MFCGKCGTQVDDEAVVCPNCGCATTKSTPASSGNEKSKLVTLLLLIFLGEFGIHDFYLGYNQNGIIKIILTFCTCSIGSVIWCLVDLVKLLTGSLNCDANGVPLKKEF